MHFKFADTALVGFVIATAAMLVIPLPTTLLDLLLVVNISFSVLLLLVGLYIPNAQALYAFPTVLLLTTLFRLGLNVASSRLILSQGDAGRVIEAFGSFLIGGELVVGVIVFCIITVVNFIVISKGAARVSEVAARFSLDALPGKQLAIDNDARAGLISADDAKQKRDTLTREGQLYGSMDGAMNFVQGDAIAGFFIIAANIIGGMYLGLAGGMSVSEAVQTYTILTVGDGLVTQVPSLLTSICAGIVVTRVGSSDVATLSGDLKLQFFSQPLILFFTAAILFLFSIIPGIPMLPFASVAVVIAGFATVMYRKRRAGSSAGASSADFARTVGLPSPTKSATLESDLEDGDLRLELDQGQLYRAYRGSSAKFLAEWRDVRTDFFADVGVMLPEVTIASNDLLGAGEYRVYAGGVEMISGRAGADLILVELAASHAATLGVPVVEEETHPVSGHRVLWTTNAPAIRKILEAASIRYYDFFSFILLKITAFCLKHPEEFLTVTVVHSLLRQVEKRYPGLVGEGFGREFLTVPKLTEVLQELVKNGASVRDFKGMIEAVASYCSANGVMMDSDQNLRLDEAVAFIRAAKRRPLMRRFLGSAKRLKVVVVSPSVEEVLEGVEFDSRALPLPLAEEEHRLLSSGLERSIRPVYELGVHPVAILCRGDLRAKVRSVVDQTEIYARVIGIDELEPGLAVEQIGTWSLAQH